MEHKIHNETHKDKRWILNKNKITYGPPCIKCGCLESYDSTSCYPCPECSYAVETWSNRAYGGGNTQVYCMKCSE